MPKPLSLFSSSSSSTTIPYGRIKAFPPIAEHWKTTLGRSNLPARVTPSSFSKEDGVSNSEMGRLKSRSAPFVRGGILFTPELMDPNNAQEVFEGNAKFQWLDHKAGFCHLCQEPFSNGFIHVGEREHHCMATFVYLYSLYPHRHRNQWSAKEVLKEACMSGRREKAQGLTKHTAKISKLPFWRSAASKWNSSENSNNISGDLDPISAVGRFARSDPMTMDPSHLFTLDDEQRYNELEALLTFAATRDLEMMTEESLMNQKYHDDEVQGKEEDEEELLEMNNASMENEDEELEDGEIAPSAARDSASSTGQTVETPSLPSSSSIMTKESSNNKNSNTRDIDFDSSSSVRSNRRPTLLAHVLQSKQQIPLHSQGEKMFRESMARMITEMFPPLAPVSFSQFEHKCYGRTNEFLLYSRIGLDKIQEMVGGTALTSKDQRAYCIRNLVWELIFSTEFRCDEVLDPVAVTIGREILRRLAFELIYSMSMHFMNKAQFVVEMLDYPTVEDLARLNSL